MKVGLVGGIFGRPAAYQQQVGATPEVLLLDGLTDRGHQVRTASHFELPPADVDVLHVHHLSYGALMAALDRRGVPYVFTSHSAVPSGSVRRRALGRVLDSAERIVALSEREAESYAGLGVPSGKVTVIPNGVPSGPFPYVPMPPLAMPVRILYVGQLIPSKGLRLLLDALSELRGRVDLALDLVYQGGSLEAELHAYVGRMGLQNVTFHGVRTGSELHAMYAGAHVLALPSLSEAQPSVVTEALYVGRPVLATRVGDVESQVAGFGSVVPPGDRCALATGLLEIISRYDSFAELAPQASAEARERFSVERMVQRHERLYRELLEHGPATRSGPPHRRLAARTLRAYAAIRGAYTRSRSV